MKFWVMGLRSIELGFAEKVVCIFFLPWFKWLFSGKNDCFPSTQKLQIHQTSVFLLTLAISPKTKTLVTNQLNHHCSKLQASVRAAHDSGLIFKTSLLQLSQRFKMELRSHWTWEMMGEDLAAKGWLFILLEFPSIFVQGRCWECSWTT